MKKQISPRLASIIFSILIICFAIAFYTFAAWQEPTSPQPGGNVLPPINVSNIEQYKSGGLGIGGVFRAYSLAVFDGNVGIGTTSPTATLDVRGTVSMFGSWTNKTANIVYQAETDGFIMARGYFTATNGYIVIRTDGANPPTITRQSKGGTATTQSGYIYSVMSPVRKGDFYIVETSGFKARTPQFPAFDNIYWLPIGK